MLTIYRRHESVARIAIIVMRNATSARAGSKAQRMGKYIRQALKTRSWERAEELRRELEDAGRPRPVTLSVGTGNREILCRV